MIETTPEGFKILIGVDGSRQFMIDSKRLEECESYIRERHLTFIGINSFLGYEARDLGFLEGLSDFIEGLTIPENHFDTTVINELHHLKYLGFADNRTSYVDLSNFPNLSTLACEMSPRLLGLESCEQLKQLTLSSFRPKIRNLSELPKLGSLKEINVFDTNIVSLDGIQKFSNLASVSIFKANQLENIDELGDLSNTISKVEIDKCKKISSYAILGHLQHLKRLIVLNSADIPSLDFVRHLPVLKFLSFVGTKIQDGDLSPCVGIDYVGFDDKNHYNMRFADFQKVHPSTPQGN